MLQGNGEQVKKADIDAIMEHFNIDAANPVICLTQAITVHSLIRRNLFLAWQKKAKQEKGPLIGDCITWNPPV